VFRHNLSPAATLLIFLLASAAQQKPQTGASAAPPRVVITDQQNRKEVELPTGAVLLLRLPSNPSTGYRWAVIGDPSPLKLVKSSYKTSNGTKHMAGAPGTQELRFTASSAGIATLSLEYRRPWEHDVAAKKFVVKVEAR
jgi:inhibitor of cysteine peptidase